MNLNRRLPLAVVLAGVACAAAPSIAGAAETPRVVTSPSAPGLAPKIFPSVTTTIMAQAAVKRDCLGRSRTGRGIARATFTAPADGQLTAQLRGRGFADDWDLVAFDARGRRMEGSAAFFANEVVKGFMRKGETAVLQACRLKGRDRSMPLTTTFVGVPLTTSSATAKIKFLKVRIIGRTEFERLEEVAGTTSLIDVTHDVQGGRAMVITYGADGLDKLRRAGFVFEVVNEDMAATYRRERARDRAQTRELGKRGSPLPSGRTEYRFIEDYYTELKKLVDENPGLVRPVGLTNKSAEGRDLTAVEIAANVTAPAEGRPYFVLNAMHHAREWPSAETSMEFAIDLVKSFKAGDPRIVKLLQNTRVIVQPMSNVDGYNNSRRAPIDPDPDGGLYNATGLAPGPGANAYRRKNCNFPFPPAVPCELQLGVDPNRNYPESWGGPGASSVPISQTYRGPAPSSEPEIKAVRELVSKFQTTSFITVHNVAALILRPPGLEADGFAPDEEGLKALGDRMGDATGYTSQYGWQLYDTTGTTDDWSYAATGGYGYTIEVGPPSGEFHMNYETGVTKQYLGTEETAGGLREAYLLGAEHASNPAANGRIAGRAPAGRTLRLKKEFMTKSFGVCAVAEATPLTGGDGQPDYCGGGGAVQETPEKIETTITVPASGRFTYWTNPSTRPFVKREGKTESYTLTCEDAGKVIETKTVTVDRGQVVNLDLPCAGTLVEAANLTGTPVTTTKPGSKAAKAKAAYKKCLAKAKKRKGKKTRSKAQAACKKTYRKALRR